MDPLNTFMQIFAFLVFTQFAAGQGYSIENYGARQGLNTSELYCVMQDSRGYLWVGSNQGLSRFDGYRFINHTRVGGHRLGDVWTLEEGADGVLWVGSGEGLFYFLNGKLVRMSVIKQSGGSVSVSDLLIDPKGNLWVGDGSGPFMISRSDLDQGIADSTHSVAVQVCPAWSKADLIDYRVQRIALDGNDNLIIGNSHYLARIADQKLSILVSRLQSRSRMTQLKVDRDGAILWSGENGHVQITTGVETSKLSSDVRYVSDFIGDRTEMLILVQPHAIFHQKHELTELWLDLRDSGINYPRSFISDREGNLWIVSFSGLHKVSFQAVSQFAFKDQNLNRNIYSIETLPDGRIMLGRKEGRVIEVNIHNGGTSREIARVAPRAQVIDMHVDAFERLWVATYYQGLFVRDQDGWEKLDDRQPLHAHADAFEFIYETKTDEIWVGGEQAVSCITFAEKKSFDFKSYFLWNDPDETKDLVVHSATRDRFSQMWFASNAGLLTINDGQLKPYEIFVEGAKVEDVVDVAVNDDGDLWLATPTLGLLQYRTELDGELELSRRWSTSDGLSSDVFMDLFVDSQGRLWAASHSGVCMLNLRRDSFPIICLDESAGYTLGGYSFLDMAEDAAGRIWVGTTAGLVSIDPEHISVSEVPAIPHLEAVLLDGKQVDFSPWCDSIDQRSGLPINLILPYHQNYLSFAFNAISLTNSANIRYRYQLAGADRNWLSSFDPTTINYSDLRPGEYVFQLQATNSDGIWSTEEIYFPFEIHKPFWGRWWFVPALAGLVFASVVFYYRRREAKLRLRQAGENRINKLISELKIRALRSQMNPHFIFNCLNSIQACIGDQKPEVASHYLAKFSTLLRMVLNNSDKNLIDIETEIEFLSLYLDLEKLRFGQTFEYFIEVSPQIDPEEIRLPSFLIQPFVENSIWHGHMHQEGSRKLWVRFDLLDDKDQLLCSIEDNGVGRSMSQAHQRRQKHEVKHQSKGMQLSTDRIELIKIQSRQNLQFEILDLFNTNNKPSGTKVILTLPLEYQVDENYA